MNIDFRCQYQYFDGIIVMIIIIIVMAMENVARKPNLIVASANRYRGLSQFLYQLRIGYWQPKQNIHRYVCIMTRLFFLPKFI